jgi:hypothetical protein
MRYRSENVHFMPKQLQLGVLYVSKEFSTAAHLCACGCGTKIRTPLGPTEWKITESPKGPTLWPSVGNWQQRCRSHYVIRYGEVLWAGQWTEAEVTAGRARENHRRQAYYQEQSDRYKEKPGMIAWLKRIFRG